MSRVRVVFLGTPDFATVCLKRLLDDEHYEVVGVVTQPDRPQGRKLMMTPSSVKLMAVANGLRVISPESIKVDSILEEIRKWKAEIAVVVAYGQILNEAFLKSFRFGAVNVHGSLLPLWRGAAPIQRSVEAGDTETGVTLQKIVKELDAGDIIGMRKMRLDENKTAMELYHEMAAVGADLLHVELMDYVRGNLAPHPQDAALATFAKKIDKSESLIQWNQPARMIHNKIRALTMGPGTFTNFNGKKLKIHSTLVSSAKSGASSEAGTVDSIHEQSFTVTCKDGSLLEVLNVQPESRSRMPAGEFIKGYQLKTGDRFL